MDTFYVLSGILIEKCFFRYLLNHMQNQGAIDQVTLDNQSVDAIDVLATPGLFQH